MSIREHLETEERERLAPYAVRAAESKGRRHPDSPHPYRTAFQQDRDRVIHTPAFRRLAYKTQVFLNFEGGTYRTRLTHTLEASQIARTIARALGLNEDLTEAVTLAHDLGHPPFGHAGEYALDKLVREAGDEAGFEHNRHSLRLVDELEGRHPSYRGLNLTWDVREGITKHRFPVDPASIATFESTSHTSLEAQVADIADAIAYSCHDLDDALQAKLLPTEVLAEFSFWSEAHDSVRAQHADMSGEHARGRTVEYLIDRLATDVIASSSQLLHEAAPSSVDDVRTFDRPLVGFSPSVEEQVVEIRAFLFEHAYNHFQVVRMREKGQRLLRDLFRAYLDVPAQLPSAVQERLEDGMPLARTIVDYLAAMTDRNAVDEHKRLFEIETRLLP
jgi:dGTPase